MDQMITIAEDVRARAIVFVIGNQVRLGKGCHLCDDVATLPQGKQRDAIRKSEETLTRTQQEKAKR